MIFVGDNNQLPPVSPGHPFRDAIRTGMCPVTRLEVVHRNAGTLRENSAKVLAGKIDLSPCPDWRPLIVGTEEGIKTEIIATCRELKSLGIGPTQIQVLSFINGRKLGVDELNKALRPIWVDDVPEKPGVFTVGDKVVYTKNNYTAMDGLGIMNGEIGIVEAIGDDPAFPLQVRLPEKNESWLVPKDDVGRMKLAFAMTVHKSQGSEWPYVIVACHKSMFMLHRSILYTGVTRARKCVWLAGDRYSLEFAAKTIAGERMTLESALAKVGGTI